MLKLMINIYISVLIEREVKMPGHWPSSLFVFLWTKTKILTKPAWSIKDLYSIKNPEKNDFVYFQAMKRRPVISKSDGALRFSLVA